MTRDWRPLIHEHSIRTRGAIPEPGQLIACPDRRAYRVIGVYDRDFANWHEQTVQQWEKAGRPDPKTWKDRERGLELDPVVKPHPRGKDRIGRRLTPWAWNEQWWALPDPYPACVECQMLWPCPCDDRNRAAAAAMKELERLGGVLPGCCWACSEPITSRQHSIEFPGENLLLPGAPSPIFHTSHSRKSHQGTCRSEAEAYEQKWVAAAPERRVLLRCEGVLFRHFGYSECTARDACPGEGATHREFAHCTTGLYVAWTQGSGGESVSPLTSCGERGCRGPKQ